MDSEPSPPPSDPESQSRLLSDPGVQTLALLLQTHGPEPSPPPQTGFHTLSFSSRKVQIPSLPQIQESRCYPSSQRLKVQLIFSLVCQTQELGPSPLSSDSSLCHPPSLRPRISDPSPPPTATGMKIPALLFQPQGSML